MWRYLHSGLPQGCVRFGSTVESLGDDPNAPTVDGEVFDVALIADGGFSSLRGKYFDEDGRQPEYSGYQIFWGRADAADCGRLSSFDGRTELIGPYAAVPLPVPSFDGRKTYMCAFFVPTPEREVTPPKRGDNRQIEQVAGHGNAPEWFLPFVRRLFGEHAERARKRSPGTTTAADDLVRFAETAATKGKITASPVYEFGVSKTVNRRIVVMGDAAHLASPMTAAGAHTAVLDAFGLLQAFTSRTGSIDGALRAYDKGATQRVKSLLRTSRAVSKDLLPKEGKGAVRSPATLLAEQHTGVAATSPQSLLLV